MGISCRISKGLGLRRKTKNIRSGLRGILAKKAIRRVGLAYRELIGSLYESWTIGIERVYKWLNNSVIQHG